MAASSKNTRMQSRLEKAARENHNLSVDYEVQAKIIREKTARLKALRLAKEAAEKKNLWIDGGFSRAVIVQNHGHPCAGGGRIMRPMTWPSCKTT